MARARNGLIPPRKVRLAIYALVAVALAWEFRSHRALTARGAARSGIDFALPDTSGRTVTLRDFRGGKAVVLAFTGIDCPIGNLYMPRLVELSRAYRRRGVAFVAINSNAHETAAQIAEHARGFGVDFPVLKDPENRFADRLLVERTCEVVVLDGLGAIRYRGAIDDQYNQKSRRDRPSRSFLVEALDALLAGRAVALATTPVIGCPIDRTEVEAPRSRTQKFRAANAEIKEAWKQQEGTRPLAVGPISYADVALILQAKCQSCHRPGQVGRFSLRTYEQAKRWAASIREVVDDRRMPPWHADPRFGHFENDRSLSPIQRATLLAWVDQGAPRGEAKKVPAPPSYPFGWTIGRPDLVLQMAEDYEVAPEGSVPYKRFRVPTGFAEDRWVQAVEARPGDRSVVHHIVVFVDDHKSSRDDRLRYMKTHLVTFAPGDLPSNYPAGTAKKIPAGSDLVFEVHYTPIGQPRRDRSAIGLIFANHPVTRRAFTMPIPRRDLVIPPGADNFAVRSSYTFPRDGWLLSLMPHMHTRGKDFRYTATFPDGRSEVLLSVPAYDFSWQSTYRLAKPLPIPRGTRIDCLAHFDNSAANPANPDPTKTVTWGEQTWDEMMIGFVDFAEELPSVRFASRP